MLCFGQPSLTPYASQVVPSFHVDVSLDARTDRDIRLYHGSDIKHIDASHYRQGLRDGVIFLGHCIVSSCFTHGDVCTACTRLPSKIRYTSLYFRSSGSMRKPAIRVYRKKRKEKLAAVSCPAFDFAGGGQITGCLAS